MLDLDAHFITIADALATRGWFVGPSIFDATLSRALSLRAQALACAGELHAAAVGRAGAWQQSAATRSDHTHWLADYPVDADEQQALRQIHRLRTYLNEALFVGARTAELHFARYAPGAFYGKHFDRFRDDDARVISLVFYLNDVWPHDAGGELLLYSDTDRDAMEARVLPLAGTMVCFLSDRFPHEVLPAKRERYSLTGWLRRSPRPGRSDTILGEAVR